MGPSLLHQVYQRGQAGASIWRASDLTRDAAHAHGQLVDKLWPSPCCWPRPMQASVPALQDFHLYPTEPPAGRKGSDCIVTVRGKGGCWWDGRAGVMMRHIDLRLALRVMRATKL